MIRWYIVIYTILILISIVLVLPTSVSASSNFLSDYNVTYSVNENGNTHANLNMTLTNKTSEYYASSYKIQMGFETINNIKASDPDGPITPTLEKSEEGYTIDLLFNKKVVGLDKKLDFNLSFDTPNVAKKYGKIWEIEIPGIANPDEFDTFTVNVQVPPSFGNPKFTKPYKPIDKLIFDKKQLNKSGISITFGDRQYYSFHLNYHLNNENLYPVKTDIALPPDTNYQKVFISNVHPSPDKVYLDKDKNWLATFTIPPSKKMDVSVDGKTEIFLTPKSEELTPADFTTYLEDKPYWQANSSEIKQLANELKTPEQIYQFVLKSLKYDFSRVTDDKPRLGAVNALKNPDSAVCLEYTDLYIALARAAGIPAREVDGFAYTQNSKQRPLSLVKDILHAWPEYYDKDKQTWFMVDPTWGSTTNGVDYFSTLDFDHLTFVIKGLDSNYPVPAGGYKFNSDKYTKDVAVDFAQNIPQEENNFEIFSELPKDAMTSVPIKGKIIIKNTSQNLIPAQTLSVSSQSLSPSEQTLQVPAIPPLGSADLEITFQPESFFTSGVKKYTITADDHSITLSINISPLLIKQWWQLGAGIAGSLFIIIIIIIFIRSSISKKNKTN